MDKATTAKLISFVGFILATAAISWTINGSYVVDRPVQSCCLGFFLAGGALIVLHIIFRQFWDGDGKSYGSPEIPLRRVVSPEPTQEIDLISPRAQRIAFGFAVLAICARVEVFRQTLGYRQCSIPGIEGFLPFLVSVREHIVLSQQRRRYGSKTERPEQGSTPTSRLVTNPFRRFGPAALIATANYLAAHVSASSRSTYICPIAYGGRPWTLLLQCMGVILDCAVLFSIQELLRKRRSGTSSTTGKALVIVGALLIVR